MESIGAKEFSTLADYVAVLRRRRAVVLVAVCLVPVAALLFSLRQDKVYEASADVLLSRTSLASVLTGTPDQNAGQDPERFAQTQASLARDVRPSNGRLQDGRHPGERRLRLRKALGILARVLVRRPGEDGGETGATQEDVGRGLVDLVLAKREEKRRDGDEADSDQNHGPSAAKDSDVVGKGRELLRADRFHGCGPRTPLK